MISLPIIAIPDGWLLTYESKKLKIWLLEKNLNVSATLEIKKQKKQIDWSQVDENSFLKKLEIKKKKMLFFAGIKDWSAKNYQWTHLKTKHELKVDGEYIDSSGERISFLEIYIYENNQSIKILHTRPFNLRDGIKIEAEIIDYIRNNQLVFN